MKKLNLNEYSFPEKHLFINASAGTGKTYTLTHLTIKLIEEKNIPIDQILIMTYTIDATEELRKRLREEIESKIEKNPQNTQLIKSLENFDDLSILTFDSFFQKIITQFFYKTSINPSFKIDNTKKFIEESLLDYFRKDNYSSLDKYHTSILKVFNSYTLFIKTLSQHLFGNIEKNITLNPNQKQQEYFQKSIENFTIGSASHIQYLELINNIKSINIIEKGKSKNALDNLTPFLSHLETIKNPQDLFIYLEQERTFKQKSFKSLMSIFNVLMSVETSPYKEIILSFFKLFFPHLTRSHSLENVYHHYQIATFIQQLLPELKKIILNKQIFENKENYNSILYKLHEQISLDHSLAQTIRNQYSAIFIDEFQDTNQMQWNIFKLLFYNKDKYISIVGDPKQSIYTFRGSDLFIYDQVKNLDLFKKNLHYLSYNYRSTHEMIDALNSLNSVLFHESFIHYNNIFPPNETELSKKKYTPAIVIYSKEADVYQTYAQNILSLLNNGVEPSKISILTNTNKELNHFKKILKSYNINVSSNKKQSILSLPIAQDFLNLLDAIANPYDINKIKLALLSVFFSFTTKELQIIFSEHFQKHQSKIHKSFIKASFFLNEFQLNIALNEFQTLSHFLHNLIQKKYIDHRIRLKLKDRTDQTLINFEYLSEIILEIQSKYHYNAYELHQHFNQLILENNNNSETLYPIRINNHQQIQAMTIHASKGLENQYIFLYSNNKIKPSRQISSYTSNEYLLIDFLKDKTLKLHEKQLLEYKEEIKRKLYVGFTRTIKELHIHTNSIEEKKLSLIKNKHIQFAPEFVFDGTKYEEKETTHNHIYLNTLHHRSSIMKRYTDIMSYSSIISTHKKENLVIDSNNQELSLENESHIQNIKDTMNKKTLPLSLKNTRGKNFGLFLHSILEVIDYNDFKTKNIENILNNENVLEMIKKKSLIYFNKEWFEFNKKDIIDLLLNIITTDIQINTTSFQLINIQNKKNEIEFYFPLKKQSTIYFKHLNTQINKTENAYIKGFIDMIFQFNNKYYIIDWKTNYLGEDFKSYDPTSIKQEYEKQKYNTQMYLYICSLHLFLEKNKPDFDYNQDIGGCLYLFVRGMNKSLKNNGVLHLRPNKKEIENFMEDLL